MKVVLQRVNSVKLFVENNLISEIGEGLILFVGFSKNDNGSNMSKLAKKIVELRIFRDENQKMNLSLLDTNGEIMIVSNFTLYADTTRGNRPNFSESKPSEQAFELYNNFIEEIKKLNVKKVVSGIFGAHMHIEQNVDGPINIIFES